MGFGKLACLRIASCAMLVVFPVALFGGELTPAAMLFSHGDTALNGNNIPRSSALFTGDLIQTRADSVANINVTGSTVLILNDSLVEYEGSAVKLEHGGVTVSTSKSMAIDAGSIHVSPHANASTEFEVRDVDGTVRIAARKGDLTISDDKGTTTLAQGQETTREESEAPKDAKTKSRTQPGAAAPMAGAVFNSPVAVGIGAAAVVGITTWVLTQSDNPASPVK